MTALPWSPVDSDTDSLLTELAADRITQAAVLTDATTTDPEWDTFRAALEQVAEPGGRVSPNAMRPLIKGIKDRRRIGPFYRRACREGLIEWRGDWEVSADTAGRNAGRPARTYRRTA